MVDIEEEVPGKVDICEYNTDGFTSNNTESIPLLPDVTVAVDLIPDLKYIRLKRLDHGARLINGDLIAIKDIPHVRLCSNHDSNCEVFIVFPGLYNASKEYNYFDYDTRTVFINQLLLPSIKVACSESISVFNRFPRTLKQALSTGGFTSYSSPYFLTIRLLSDAVLEMRNITRDNDELVGYSDFFFKTVAWGYKESLSINLENELELPLLHILDYSKIEASQSFIDVGLNARWIRDDKVPTISFMKEACKNTVINRFVQSAHIRSKFYHTSNSSFGNCGYKMSTLGNSCDPLKFIAYSDIKYHFVGPLKGKKSGLGYFTDMFPPADLHKTSPSIMRLVVCLRFIIVFT